MRSIFEDKQSEKRMFDIWKEGEERADAAALGMASFKMEQSQARKQLYNSIHEAIISTISMLLFWHISYN